MLKKGFKAMLAEANAAIETLSVEDAIGLHAGAERAATLLFVDVRESDEVRASGTIAGALHAPRGFIEFFADPESPMHKPEFGDGRRLILFCASGGRSALAAKTLADMGFEAVGHIAGGFTAWREANGAVE